jgi:predicted RND superfamily exporter protein
MTMSSAALMLGFMVAATSHLETTVEFALLATVTIAVAWLASAILLPTLLLPSSHANETESDQNPAPSTTPQTHPAASHEN